MMTRFPSKKQLLTPRDVQEILFGSSEQSFYEKTLRIIKQDMDHLKVGQQYFVKRKTLDAWLGFLDGDLPRENNVTPIMSHRQTSRSKGNS